MKVMSAICGFFFLLTSCQARATMWPLILALIEQKPNVIRSCSPEDSSKMELLDRLYYSGNFVEGIAFGRSLVEKIHSKERSQFMAQIHNRLGTLYTALGNHEGEAFHHLNEALAISTEINWELGASIVYNNLGNVYRDLGYYLKAHEYYIAALNTSKLLNDSVGVAFAYKNLGILFEVQGWEQKALLFHQYAYSIRTKLGNPREILSSLMNIGTTYNKFNKHDRAIVFLERADSLARYLKSEMQSEVSLELGNSYYHLKNVKEAEIQYQRSLKLAILSNKSRTIHSILYQMAHTQMNQKNYQHLALIIEKMKAQLDTIQYPSGNVQYYSLIYKLDSLQDRELSSLRNFKVMILLKDSLNSLSNAQDLLIRQNVFELMQKDEAINTEREKQRSQQQIFFGILVLLLILTLSLGFAVRQKIKSGKKIREKQDQILENNRILKVTNEELETTLSRLRNAEVKIHMQNLEIQSHNADLIGQLKTRTDEMIVATSRLGHFSFLVSHNLRGPVARLLGLRALLGMSESKKETEEILCKLNSSIEEVDNITSDINKVLDTQFGVKVKLERIETDLLVRTVLDTLKREIEFAQAQITCTIEATPFFFSSLQYMRSILEHLIINSLKFRNEEKRLTVSICVSSSDHFTEFAIIDNGLGVDLSLYGHQIFTPYKRFHFHRTGKGFNLFLTKCRVEALGGSINFESQVNTFTRVSFRLPNSPGLL